MVNKRRTGVSILHCGIRLIAAVNNTAVFMSLMDPVSIE